MSTHFIGEWLSDVDCTGVCVLIHRLAPSRYTRVRIVLAQCILAHGWTHSICCVSCVCCSGLFIISPDGTLRQKTVNDLPVGRRWAHGTHMARVVAAQPLVHSISLTQRLHWSEGQALLLLVILALSAPPPSAGQGCISCSAAEAGLKGSHGLV